MKFKLDENLNPAVASFLGSAGHDVATVTGQGHGGIPDEDLMEVCRSEGRCLVTMDLGFADPFEYPPRGHAGVVVFRLRGRAGPESQVVCARTLVKGLQAEELPQAERRSISWIVEPGRVRTYRVEEPDEEQDFQG